MITLYSAGGASDFTIHSPPRSNGQQPSLLDNAVRLLEVRGFRQSATLLTSVPFDVVPGTNSFCDDFLVLCASVALQQYETLRQRQQDRQQRDDFARIALVLAELGSPVRFIAIELTREEAGPQAVRLQALRGPEIRKLVHKYIGVSSGYLGDFTYQSHHDFYVELDLDIDPYEKEGTTRERFEAIIGESDPPTQARILEGVLRRFPVGSSDRRTAELAAEIQRWIARLQGQGHVEQPQLRFTSDVVERALQDAQELLSRTGAVSGVDRVHTALHGYLRNVCADAGLDSADGATLNELFKEIRQSHPAFNDMGPRSDDIGKVLRAISSVLDTLNPLRNLASIAHPNTDLLPEAEAMLVINAARSILRYVDDKVRLHPSAVTVSKS